MLNNTDNPPNQVFLLQKIVGCQLKNADMLFSWCPNLQHMHAMGVHAWEAEYSETRFLTNQGWDVHMEQRNYTLLERKVVSS